MIRAKVQWSWQTLVLKSSKRTAPDGRTIEDWNTRTKTRRTQVALRIIRYTLGQMATRLCVHKCAAHRGSHSIQPYPLLPNDQTSFYRKNHNVICSSFLHREENKWFSDEKYGGLGQNADGCSILLLEKFVQRDGLETETATWLIAFHVHIDQKKIFFLRYLWFQNEKALIPLIVLNDRIMISDIAPKN